MSCKTYFRFALVLPLLAALFLLGPQWSMPLRHDEFGVHGGLPLYLAMIPYGVFIAAFLAWSGRKSDESFMRAVWLAPLLSIPFGWAAWAVLNYDSQWALSRNCSLLELSWLAVAIAAAGYLYVLVAAAICRAMRRIGWLK